MKLHESLQYCVVGLRFLWVLGIMMVRGCGNLVGKLSH